MSRRFILAASCALASLCLVGCAATSVPATSVPSNPATKAEARVEIRPMTLAEKRDFLAPNFLAEVPVPFGEVVRAKAQGPDAWDYEILVANSPAAVVIWYMEAYSGREWTVEQATPTDGLTTLTLTKNAAEARVTITREADGRARVSGVLGVGAPVLQTQ